MSGNQHASIGAVSSICILGILVKVFSLVINPVQSAIIVVGSLVGSLMPDIDSKKSKASKAFNKVLLYIIILFFGLNVISDFVNVDGLNSFISDVINNGFFGSFGMMLFVALVVAGKLSPHRGFTHKWLGTLAFCLVALITFNPNFSIGFIIGYLLHIVADRFTKAGKNLDFLEFRLPCQNSKGNFKPVF